VLKNVLSTNEKQNPVLSVLTYSFNHAKFLRETIDSVFRQQYENFEYIFIDAESTDGTQDILKEYKDIDWLSEPDGECGALSAFIKGLGKVSGDYVIQCCVSDGFLDSNWFKDGVEFLENNPDYSLVWALEQRLTEEGLLSEITRPEYFDFPPPDGRKALISWLATGITYPESNYIVRTKVLKECFPDEKKSPEHHKIQPHLGFIFNFHCADYKSKYLPRVVSWSRIHKEQRFKRLKKIERPAAMKYLKDINKLKLSLLFGKKTVTLVDGSVISVPNFSKFERIKLIFSIFKQKIRYSRFVIKPISRIYKSFLRRLNLYKIN
ncbi:uncharacterized protein METZ01_LOCUS233500, partial [marine metagenome]